MGGSVDDFWRACKAAVQNRILTCITVGLLRANYTQDEMTSQNLWSRYVRHFVGVTWHNALS